MNNRVIILIVVSLFLLIPYSTYAEEGDSGSEESKPDYIVEPVWDDDAIWSYGYDGVSPEFKIKNIGGPLTAAEKDACRENCNYWIIINEGKDDGYNLTYNIATWSDMAQTALLEDGEYMGYFFPRIFGVTDVKVCFDYENPDSIVDESNETNNCWEGTINFFPDLRWYDGNPNGSDEVWLEARLDNTVFRLGISPTRRGARQLVTHKHITVNGEIVNIPSFTLKENDVIGVREKSKSLESISNSLSANAKSFSWLEWDSVELAGKFLNPPTREEIPENIKEQLIVELYSK